MIIIKSAVRLAYNGGFWYFYCKLCAVTKNRAGLYAAAKLFFNCALYPKQTYTAVDVACYIVKFCGIAHLEDVWQVTF